MKIQKFSSLALSLIDLLFPGQCHSCGEPLESRRVPYFCGTCWQKIEPVQSQVCPGCGKPFQSPFALTFSPAHRCGDCRAHPYHFDGLASPFRYEGTLSRAIGMFKYGKKRALAPHLASLIFPFIHRYRQCGLIVPVPLHSGRLRAREFNQSYLLAREAGRSLGIPVASGLLTKVRPTGIQRELNQNERRRNLKGAFRVSEPAMLQGKDILLIDDVLTTGETLNECARTLKKNGAAKVFGAVLARTPLRKETGPAKNLNDLII